jgi:hypothetical protein
VTSRRPQAILTGPLQRHFAFRASEARRIELIVGSDASSSWRLSGDRALTKLIGRGSVGRGGGGSVRPDTSCAVFARDLDLDPNEIHRFVVGEDPKPRTMTAAEAQAELGDPFATLVLLQGKFPRKAEETLAAIKAAAGDGDPLRNQMSFLLGEGSQIPFDQAPGLDRGLRFVVTLGATANGPPVGPDVLVSVFDPASDDIELMAWDRQKGGFNFYRSVGEPAAWVFAGNAHHALTDPTQGKGPFESHKSGALLMKELKLPWINWDSPNARIFATAFGDDDERRTHPWFTQKEPGGAYTFELAVARPAMERWGKVRFDELAAKGAVEEPARIIEQLVATPTANLFTSVRESESVSPTGVLDLPQTFFVDADGLAAVGLAGPPEFTVERALYATSLKKFDVELTDGNGFVQKEDTHFAFVIPERAFEDQVALREAIRIGLVSRRLAASLLMTDFPNPVFSARRAALLAHVPESATISDGASSFSQEMADAIVAAADTSSAGSPEREFKDRWTVGEDFSKPFNTLLGAYYKAVTQKLETQAGFDAYVELAESRRERIREMPIFENQLLFARTNIASVERVMNQDGSVNEAA